MVYNLLELIKAQEQNEQNDNKDMLTINNLPNDRNAFLENKEKNMKINDQREKIINIKIRERLFDKIDLK